MQIHLENTEYVNEKKKHLWTVAISLKNNHTEVGLSWLVTLTITAEGLGSGMNAPDMRIKYWVDKLST